MPEFVKLANNIVMIAHFSSVEMFHLAVLTVGETP